MHRRRGLNGIEHPVDSFQGPILFLRMPGQVGLVYLNHIRIDCGNLAGQHICQCQTQFGLRAIMLVEQGLAQHVRPRKGKFHRP